MCWYMHLSFLRPDLNLGFLGQLHLSPVSLLIHWNKNRCREREAIVERSNGNCSYFLTCPGTDTFADSVFLIWPVLTLQQRTINHGSTVHWIVLSLIKITLFAIDCDAISIPVQVEQKTGCLRDRPPQKKKNPSFPWRNSAIPWPISDKQHSSDFNYFYIALRKISWLLIQFCKIPQLFQKQEFPWLFQVFQIRRHPKKIVQMNFFSKNFRVMHFTRQLPGR